MSLRQIVLFLAAFEFAYSVAQAPTAAPTGLYYIPPHWCHCRTCFSGEETVTLESGESKPFAELSIGDSILSATREGTVSYSPVVFLPHGENKKSSKFVKVITENKKEIKMTRGHLIPLCNGKLESAKDLNIGDCMRTVDGEDIVANVSRVKGEGLYTAVTQNEFVVVNGIVASPFASNAAIAHAFFNLTDMQDWCNSNNWLAFENARRPELKSLHKQDVNIPSTDCLSMLEKMFENYKDEPVGWGVDGWGYRGWNKASIPSVVTGWK
jgi:hypothetical protein